MAQELPKDFFPPDDVNTTEYETVVNWVVENTVYIYAKSDVRHSGEDAKKQMEFISERFEGTKLGVVIDIRSAPPLMAEAKNRYGSKDVSENVKGICLLVKSPVSRVIGNFYFGYISKGVKTRMANNLEEAIKWLNGI